MQKVVGKNRRNNQKETEAWVGSNPLIASLVSLFQRTLTWGKYHCTADLLFIFFGFSCFVYFFKKICQSRHLFRLFSVFSNKHYKFLQQIYVKNCPSSIWCWDSNKRPLERESSPITTRPGLPPTLCLLVWSNPKQVSHRYSDTSPYNECYLTCSNFCCLPPYHTTVGCLMRLEAGA